MKKRLMSTAMLAALALAGCTTTTGTTTNTGTAIGTANSIGMNVFKAAINTQCRSELESNTAWRLARAAMTAETETAVQTSICNCVTEQAPQQITVVDMTNAAIDSTYRKQLVTKVVAKSLTSCYTSFTNQ